MLRRPSQGRDASLSPPPRFAPSPSLVRPPSAGGDPCGDEWVTINVGGAVVSALAETLTAEPSLLQAAVSSRFAGLPRDREGHPFFDRDGGTFRHVLNYLRGYKLLLATEEVALVVNDARYYGLPGLEAELMSCGRPYGGQWRFQQGPGVSPDGSTLASTSVVAMVDDGSSSFSSGGGGGGGGCGPAVRRSAAATFHLKRCDGAGFGVVAAGSPADRSFHGQPHSVSMVWRGELAVNMPSAPPASRKRRRRSAAGDAAAMDGSSGRDDSDECPAAATRRPAPRFGQGDAVSVVLDARSGRVVFVKNREVAAAVDLPPHAPEVQLAVWVHGDTVVALQPCDDAIIGLATRS